MLLEQVADTEAEEYFGFADMLEVPQQIDLFALFLYSCVWRRIGYCTFLISLAFSRIVGKCQCHLYTTTMFKLLSGSHMVLGGPGQHRSTRVLPAVCVL